MVDDLDQPARIIDGGAEIVAISAPLRIECSKVRVVALEPAIALAVATYPRHASPARRVRSQQNV